MSARLRLLVGTGEGDAQFGFGFKGGSPADLLRKLTGGGLEVKAGGGGRGACGRGCSGCRKDSSYDEEEVSLSVKLLTDPSSL